MTGARAVNEAGRQLVRAFEGLRLEAYKCPAGLWTIGYGHTAGAHAGLTITVDEAERLLARDLARVAAEVTQLVRVDLTDNQFAALCGFAFNVGCHSLAGSTLRRLLNRGWYSQVPVQLKRWCKARGRTLPGLIRRRAAEAQLWNQPPQPQEMNHE